MKEALRTVIIFIITLSVIFSYFFVRDNILNKNNVDINISEKDVDVSSNKDSTVSDSNNTNNGSGLLNNSIISGSGILLSGTGLLDESNTGALDKADLIKESEKYENEVIILKSGKDFEKKGDKVILLLDEDLHSYFIAGDTLSGNKVIKVSADGKTLIFKGKVKNLLIYK